MDNEKIKFLLKDIHESDSDFEVVMTGKSSRRVNGLYKPDTHEILLHNQNFKNDDQLLYTAIHEYTHHLLNNPANTRYNAKCHNNEFWSLFYDLIELAEKKGIYHKNRPDRILELEEDVRRLDSAIADLQRQLGAKLADLDKACEDEGVRTEDVIDRDLQMKRTTVRKAQQAAKFGPALPAGVGQDIQSSLCSIQANRAGVRETAVAAAERNMSI